MEKIENKLAEHDRHIDILSHAIEDLSATAGQTNEKLDKVVDALNTQNVLIERMNNLDVNLKESFGRIHDRIKRIDDIQDGAGCSKLAATNVNIDSLGRSVDTIRTTVSTNNTECKDRILIVENELDTYISGATLKWFLGGISFYIIMFGIYTVSHIHALESAVLSHSIESDGTMKLTDKRIDDLESKDK